MPEVSQGGGGGFLKTKLVSNVSSNDGRRSGSCSSNVSFIYGSYHQRARWCD